MDKIRSRARLIISRAKKLLRLGNWRITVRWVKDPEWGSFGEFHFAEDRPEGELVLWERMDTSDELLDTIIHELNHPILARLDILVAAYASHLEPDLRQQFLAEWERERDVVVDHYTQIFKPILL